MLRHDLADVGSRDDDDAGLHAQSGGNRLFDGYGGVALPTRRHGEDHVAAVEHRADVQVAEALDDRPEVRHRHALRAFDVDTAQQRDADVSRPLLRCHDGRR